MAHHVPYLAFSKHPVFLDRMTAFELPSEGGVRRYDEGSGAGGLTKLRKRFEKPVERKYKDPAVERNKTRVKEWEEETRKARMELEKADTPWYLIDPRSSAVMRNWDLATAIALIFTAIFTPFEVGFVSLPEDRWKDTLFLANRAVDVIFIIDMLMQFFIMYATADVSTPAGELWVTHQGKIARKYLTSAWFIIDAISIGVSFFDIFAPTNGPLAKFKGFRAIRVLRLIKLVRLVNASRIFKRWELRISVNYAKLSIAQILFGLVFICHLFGCIWGLQASFDPLGSWPGQKEYCKPVLHDGVKVEFNPDENHVCPENMVCRKDIEYGCEPAPTMYLYSIYWAIATVTSIGYGDVAATAGNETEQLIFC